MKTMVRTVFGYSIIRFGAVGLISTLIDIGLLNLFKHWGASLLVATAIGFLAGSVNGYLLNSRYVFQKERSYGAYGKFLLVTFIGLLITEGIVHLLEPGMSFNKAKLVAVVVVFFWNYAFSKLWAFK